MWNIYWFILILHSWLLFYYEINGQLISYDCQDFRQQCLKNNQPSERQITVWFYEKSSLWSIIDYRTKKNFKFIEKQMKINDEEYQLNVEPSSDTIHVNNTNPLDIDEALVRIIIDEHIDDKLTLSIQIIQCIECSYEIIAEDLSSTHLINLTFNTAYTYRIRMDLTNKSSCEDILSLREHGQYTFNVQVSTTNSTLKCYLTTQDSGNNIYVPLIISGIILLILFITCFVAQRLKWWEHLISLKNQYLKSRSIEQSSHTYDLQATADDTQTTRIHVTEESPIIAKSESVQKVSNILVPRSKRLLSLDGFRGLTLVSMIFVNYGGGSYAEFDHVAWHGITFADIVFPFFVWMLGTSLVFSLKNGLDKGVSKKILLKKIAIRTLKLFLIGFILNTRFKVDLAYVRIPGVLQRFAIVYGVVASIEVLCTKPGQYVLSNSIRTVQIKRLIKYFGDIINFPLQWLIMIGLQIIWLLLVYLVPFENCPAGYLGPGGLHKGGLYINCTGGITGYIDRMIFTEKHIYQHPTCQEVYGCRPPYDPENLLGAIPTMFLAFLGIQTGRILTIYQTDVQRLVRFFIWSIICIVIGIGLSGGTLYGGPMPLNKNLWTLSFSFFTAGLAFAGFATMYIFVDMLKWWSATPFQYPGANSILIYVTHLIFATFFPIQWIVANTHAAHLAMTLWGCIFWIIISYILFKKRIFVVL